MDVADMWITVARHEGWENDWHGEYGKEPMKEIPVSAAMWKLLKEKADEQNNNIGIVSGEELVFQGIPIVKSSRGFMSRVEVPK